MKRFLSVLSGLAIIAASSTAHAQIDWAAGAPGGTAGGSIQIGAGAEPGVSGPGINVPIQFLETGISAVDVAPTTGADYTISAWINSQEEDADDATLAGSNRWWLGTGDQGLHLGVQQANSGLTTGHWGNDSTGATSVLVDTWVHTTHVYRAGVQEIYINGELDSSVALGAPNNDSTDLQIGARNGTDGPSWIGFIDDVAIFTSALSPADIATLANDSSQAVALGAAAYYDFEDSQAGTTAANLVSGGLGNAELDGVGAVPPPAATWTAGAPGGTSGGAVAFDGEGGSFLGTGIPAADVTGNVNDGASDYTISMWVNSGNADADGNAANNSWFFGTGNQGLHLGVAGNVNDGNSNTLQLGHWNADNSGTEVVAANTWVHATFSYDAAAGMQRIYFNGNLEGEFSADGPNRSDSDLQIGSRHGFNGPGWIGSVDDVAIFTSVLSDADVAALAADASQAPALGAIAYYDFEDSQAGSTAANSVAGGLGNAVLNGIGPEIITDDALKGDVDLSGEVNLFDISPFIAILTSPGEFQAEADVDCSGEVNLFDIAPFIAILTGNPQTP